MDSQFASNAPLHAEPTAGHSLNVLGTKHVCKATGRETAGQFSLFELVIPPGGGAPPHTHTREDECFYVLAGELLVEADGEPSPLRLGEGAFFFGARGRRHAFRNVGKAPARVLTLSLPGDGLARMFAEISASIGSPPDVQRLAAITERYGVTIEPPSC